MAFGKHFEAVRRAASSEARRAAGREPTECHRWRVAVTASEGRRVCVTIANSSATDRLLDRHVQIHAESHKVTNLRRSDRPS